MVRQVDEQGLRVLSGDELDRAYLREIGALLKVPSAAEQFKALIAKLSSTFIPGQCVYCREGNHKACWGGSICTGRCCEASNKPSPSWD